MITIRNGDIKGFGNCVVTELKKLIHIKTFNRCIFGRDILYFYYQYIYIYRHIDKNHGSTKTKLEHNQTLSFYIF